MSVNVVQTNFKYRGDLIPLNLDKVLFIILHHAEAVTATPEQIHQWHLDNGWAGFGYNEYVRKDGTVYIGRGDNIGAQCANMNSKSYGICLEGNYEVETEMSAAQFDSLIERLMYHKGRLRNLVEIAPHRKFVATACPGRYFPLTKVLDAVSMAELGQAVEVLKARGIIGSPEYWLENAVVGRLVNGEYAGILIKNTAKILKGA